MSIENIAALQEKLLTRKKTVEDRAEEADGAGKTPDKLTGKQVTAGLIALVSLLVVFFVGMRWIENRSEKLMPPDAATQTAPARATPDAGDKININTATLPELKELHGIGEKKAQAIIDYRNEYGPFSTVEEILQVDGIGEGIFAAIRDDICV